MRKGMRVKRDQKFEQNEIKRFNKKHNVHMFCCNLSCCNPFPAKQKFRKFKKLLFKTKALGKRKDKRINPIS